MQKNKILILLCIVLAVIVGILGYFLKNEMYKNETERENLYNMAFSEVVDYTENVKTFLAKSIISKSSKHGAEILTHIWRESNLALTYLGNLPIESQNLENTEKFLNQTSEYSYSISRKNIKGEDLSEDDINKLKELYKYANDLSNTLNEMSVELNNGTISWKDLMNNSESAEIAEVANFNVIEENFHEYSGLIYDGAYSNHILNTEKKGLAGNEVSEEDAKKIAEEFIGKNIVKETKNNGFVENGNIQVYRFEIKTNEDKTIGISISKKGGHVVYMDYDREIKEEKISQEDAIKKGKVYLEEKGFKNMQETYSLKNNGFITINYAYTQEDVIIYPDLIKAKIALDNGEIIGIECTGYLNWHYEREIPNNIITKSQAMEMLSKEVEILNSRMAIIPTKWNTEVLCYEFKGKVDDVQFLAYINALTGEEEDILVIIDTENGTLTE